MKKLIGILIGIILLHPAIIFADQITLKDGQSLTGKLISRTDKEVVFEISGQQLKFPVSNIQNISLNMNSTAPAPAQAAPAPETAPAPAAVQAIEVAAGTPMTISLKTALDTGRHSTGHKFTAALEANLMSGSTVAVPRGATIYGQVVNANKSGRVLGHAAMDITFTDILIKNQMYPIRTSTISTSTGRTGGKTLRTTAGAAAIGGLIDGSSGAKTGAKVGLGVSLLTRGNQVQIPSGTLFDVSFTAPLSIK